MNIVITDELLDYLGEEFQHIDRQKYPNMNFLQWVEFRKWELSNAKQLKV